MEVRLLIAVLIYVSKVYSETCQVDNIFASHVILDNTCQRNLNKTCSFTCGLGYRPSITSTNVTCTASATWDKPLSSLCEKIRCPATIPNGNLSASCSQGYGEQCFYYTCDKGYRAVAPRAGMVCGDQSQWEWILLDYKDLDFCIDEADVCPDDINNGSLSYNCQSFDGRSCSFSCNTGCKRNPDVNRVTCHNGTWDVDTDLLCTDCIKCTNKIPYGRIDMTNCYAGASCLYSCDSYDGFIKNENVSAVTCDESNVWVPSVPTAYFSKEDHLCIALRCSSDIPNGNLSSSCTAEKGANCSYECNPGYYGIVHEIICEVQRHWMYPNGVKALWNFNRSLLCTTKHCASDIPNGNLSRLCTAEIGSSCRYKCNPGYFGHTVSEINCNFEINPSNKDDLWPYWSVDPRLLCTNNQQCPFDKIPNGLLDAACQRNPGDVCSITCNHGYRPHRSSITCTSTSTWDTPFSKLCREIVCPSDIPNGYISPSCQGTTINHYCLNYDCNAGYYQSRAYSSSLKCNASGQWEWNSPSNLEFCIGEDELCPSNIKEGRLSFNCKRAEGSMCSYTCQSGCRNSLANYWLTCQNRTWDFDTDSLCTKCHTTTTVSPKRCPRYIPNGNVAYSCDRQPYSTCMVYCNSGCYNFWSTLTCGRNGLWDYPYTACSCLEKHTTTISASIKCPYSIPNGHVSSFCDTTVGSVCSVYCDAGCYSVVDTLMCNSNGYHGYWDNDLYACACHDSPPSHSTSDHGSNSGVVIGGVVAGFVLIFLIVICIWCARTSKPATQTQRPTLPPESRATPEQSVATINTPADNQEMALHDSSSGVTNFVDNSVTSSQLYLHGLPEYSDVPKPTTPPPSYYEVTSNPINFEINERSTNL